MGNRTVLQTCVAFCCGVMFGLYVYTYSSQEGQSSPVYKATPRHRMVSSGNHSNTSFHNMQRQYNNVQSNTRRRPLENGNPSKANSATIPVTKVVPSYPTFVLILAYMRSGSTLTGDVIQQDRNTVYAFEPLYNIWQRNSSTFANGDKKLYINATDMYRTEESLRQLKAWYTCDVMEVDLETLKCIFMDFGLKTRATKPCMRKYAKNNFNETAKAKCVAPLIRSCEKSSVRVVKTIRLHALDIEPLLKAFPTLKVIHLVRDPRGILVSRQRVDFRRSTWMPIADLSKDLCQRIMDDYNIIQYFTKAYPNRIMRLRYEELATYPLDTTKRIYKFIGLEATERILKAVSHMTSSKSNVEKDYNTARKNSVKTANAWRVKMPKNVTSIIDNNCAAVYERFGYIKVKSGRQLKNIKGERLWIEKINS